MALKNQNNKILKVHYLQENPSLKKNQKKKKYHKTLEQISWQETLLSLTQSFSMFYNHAKVMSFCKLKFWCFV